MKSGLMHSKTKSESRRFLSISSSSDLPGRIVRSCQLSIASDRFRAARCVSRSLRRSSSLWLYEKNTLSGLGNSLRTLRTAVREACQLVKAL